MESSFPQLKTTDKDGRHALEAKRVINLLKQDFVSSRGTFGLEKYNGELSPHHIFSDLGDFLPFLLYFGETEFIVEQINLYKSFLKNGLLVSEFPSFGISGLAKSYEYTDLLFGLKDYEVFMHTEESKSLLDMSIYAAVKAFRLSGKISSFFHSSSGVHLPLFDTRDGTFIEFFTEMEVLEPDSGHLDTALNIYKNLVTQSYFIEHGLFPTFAAYGLGHFIPVIARSSRNKFYEAEICKNNTNTLFALLSLFRVTKNKEVYKTIISVVKSIQSKATLEGGGIIKTFVSNTKATKGFLTASFAMLDFLCDFYEVSRDSDCLKYAEQIARYWISRQGKTGLFPLWSDGEESFIDSETDMCVALIKLSELTGNSNYKVAAQNCFKGIMKYHSRKNYVLGVNIQTGEVTNSAQRTKFITLFLKLLILQIEMERGVTIYGNRALHGLLKDR